jgi:hypothetical protein
VTPNMGPAPHDGCHPEVVASGIWSTTGASGRMGGVTSTHHIVPLGGLRDAPTTAPDTYTIAALIGGANLDLSGATLPPGGATITKVSLVGGVALRVPTGCRVQVSGLTLIGRKRLEQTRGATDGPLVRVRAFGLFGGVHVED